MSREIKFRAWIDDKMILPEYADWEDFFINVDGDVSKCVETGTYELFRSEKRIENVILMQFTGLKDKNGKDVFEGDLVGLFNNKNGLFTVEFKNQYVGGWVLTYPNEQDVSLGARESKEIEVIGTIHENPELLK